MIFDEAVRAGNLSQSDLAIVGFITQYPHEVVHMTARQLAEAAYVSPSTVVRLCKKAGFDSFGDMKVLLAREMADEESFERLDADFPELADASAAQVIGRVSSMEREAVRKTERLLASVNWTPILDAFDAAEAVTVFAIGYSLDACGSFVRDLRRMGKRVTVIEEESDAREWAASCPRGEFFAIVSYGGATPNAVDVARIVAARGLKSVGVCVPGAPLARHTTWALPVALTERPFASDRMSHVQSVAAEAYVLSTLYALWFARDYATHARHIAASLSRQGVRIDRTSSENPQVVSSSEFETAWSHRRVEQGNPE